MIFLWIVLGILSLLFLLFLIAMLRVRFTLECREETKITMSVLFIKRLLFPSEVESPIVAELLEIKRRPKKGKKITSSSTPAQSKPQSESLLNTIWELCDLLLTLLKNTFGHVTIHTSRVRILVATGDAASTAVLFGAVNGGAVALLEILDRFWKVKNHPGDEIEIRPDYLAETTTVDIRLLFSLRVWQIVYILYKTLFT